MFSSLPGLFPHPCLSGKGSIDMPPVWHYRRQPRLATVPGLEHFRLWTLASPPTAISNCTALTHHQFNVVDCQSSYSDVDMAS